MGFMKRSNRTVPLILNEDVEGVGFKDELVQVKAGFARNFLLPKNVGVLATPALQKDREAQIAKATARREKEVEDRQEVAKTLAAEPVVVSLKVGPGGRVFGSITATEFVKQVKEQRKVTLETKQLHGLPIHGLGAHTVSAKLGLGVVALIPVKVNGEAVKGEKSDKADKAKAKKTETAKADSEPETEATTETPEPTPTA
jgi:large subunit ribosomal protein L9